MRLLLDRVGQSYGGEPVLDGVTLALDAGRIGCLLGESGCGKTTVLRCIAGFEDISAGTITVGDSVLSGPGMHVAPERRGVGMVFQHYALFPHLNVADNVAFGLRGLARSERKARVRDMLALTGLGDVAPAWPHQLSGGQRQRVALARALAPRPRLLLLDEPFSNLDQELRYRLSAEVREILRSIGATALLVTHDQHEAFAVADDVAVMHRGHIEQWDSPSALYHRPRTPFVARFIGQGAFVPGELLADDRARTELGEVAVEAPAHSSPGDRVSVLLRPETIVQDDDGAVSARVLRRDFRGSDVLYRLELPSGGKVLSLQSSRTDHARGSSIRVRLAATRAVAFAQ